MIKCSYPKYRLEFDRIFLSKIQASIFLSEIQARIRLETESPIPEIDLGILSTIENAMREINLRILGDHFGDREPDASLLKIENSANLGILLEIETSIPEI